MTQSLITTLPKLLKSWGPQIIATDECTCIGANVLFYKVHVCLRIIATDECIGANCMLFYKVHM